MIQFVIAHGVGNLMWKDDRELENLKRRNF